MKKAPTMDRTTAKVMSQMTAARWNPNGRDIIVSLSKQHPSLQSYANQLLEDMDMFSFGYVY